MAYFYESEKTLDSLTLFDLEQVERSQLRIKANDQLNILVSSSENPAAVSSFNLPVASVGNILDGDMQPTGQPKLQTYLVDQKGTISFPVLGEIDVEGMTRNELRLYMERELAKYIKKPMVNVRLANFQISVLGEVLKPGTFPLSDEYISLPKALGLAGDLTIYGRRDNVLVLREEADGIKKVYLDLTDNEIVNSPYYYLQQNDVVYVEPNGPQRQSASYNRNASIYISIASVLVSLAVLISR
ncbi:MAG: polysaccharide biosynthesis/export family protein [Leeuwenhoekiella sp.]